MFRTLKFVTGLLLICGASHAAEPSLLTTLSEELQRNFEVLRTKGDPPAYFISYGVVEQKSRVYGATLGALETENVSGSRILDVSVRVGSPKLDNYHGGQGERPAYSTATALPMDNNPDAIRRRIWLDTDRVYRAGAQRLINLKTSTQLNVADLDKSPDFSIEQPVALNESSKTTVVSPRAGAKIPADRWPERVRQFSAIFAKHPKILRSSVAVQIVDQNKYFVNSEGSRLQHGRGFARITIGAQAKAADGMDLSTSDSFEAVDEAGLPKDSEIVKAVERVADELNKMLDAATVDPFVGPAILSGKAAGVFFHEIFGHRIEGHRQRDESQDQTFTKRVGQSVLPPFLSVVFDPTMKQIGGVDLNGTYEYDDEGVKARPVTVVDNGNLKTFLLSRTPIEGFLTSNGHGRKQAGMEPVSRQSNLIVQSSKSVSDAELRNLLIAEIKRQNKPFGYYFEKVTGGYTTTSRRGFQSFKVIPLVVYRVYPDGRPDELVRGADIVGTPLASFSRITATSAKSEVFNGDCGAESGNVPVSAVAPAILISELEIQKKEKGRDQPPLLPSPVATVSTTQGEKL